MGWFSKKEKKEDKRKEISTLPELPKLPELPQLGERKRDLTKSVHQLPSFPTSSIGEKFSQNTIKEAIAGKKEGGEVFETDDSMPTEDEIRMMQKPLRKPLTKEIGRKIPAEPKGKKTGRAEPVFIRIDKFEEGLQVFEKAKEKISEMEKMLRDIKRIREEEEKELDFWENEIQKIKEQIEKVDRDIFSKIE